MSVMSQSSIRTLPESGRPIPAMTCSRVVLPQPLRPTITICSPAATRNSGMSNTGNAVPSGCRNDFLRSFRSNIAWESSLSLWERARVRAKWVSAGLLEAAMNQ